MIILHIGAPKTGSTTIQDFLDKHGDSIFKFGLACPPEGFKKGQGHIGFRISLNKKTSKDSEFIKLRANLNHSFLKHKHVLISSEMLWNISPKRIVDVYPNLVKAHILYYIRRQEDIIESHYSQKVKGGLLTQIPNKFFDENFLLYDYMNIYEKWCSVFGKEKVHPRIYEDSIQDNLVRDFLVFGVGKLIDNEGDNISSNINNLINEDIPMAQRVVNKRLNPNQIRTILALNRINIDETIKKNIREKIIKDRVLWEEFEDGGRIFSKKLRKDIELQYEESNEKFRKCCFSELIRSKLFPKGE